MLLTRMMVIIVLIFVDDSFDYSFHICDSHLGIDLSNHNHLFDFDCYRTKNKAIDFVDDCRSGSHSVCNFCTFLLWGQIKHKSH